MKQGIATALARSDLGTYTAGGCLHSLDLWGPTGDPAYDSPPGLVGGMFFLGDSYLVYEFAFLSSRDGQLILTQQSQDATRTLAVTSSELDELTSLIAAARYDSPPKKLNRGLHNTCIVFLDAAGNYFVAHPDEANRSFRPTDKAIALADRLSQGAP